MPLNTFAAIDVGSNEVSMKIYEVSKKYGIRELDYVRHTIELGADTYTNGKISHVLVDELCRVLESFNLKMKEYAVEDYSACATSAVREATNSMIILDQIKLRSGLKIRILSNSEQRFLCYKAIALKEASFNKIIKRGAAIVDVGAGSIQISLFEKESLIATQNIKLGSLRIRELLSDMEKQTTNFNHLLEEYIDHDIMTFNHMFLNDRKIKNIIAVGDNLNDKIFYYSKEVDSISREQFDKIYSTLLYKSNEEISEKLQISNEQASLVLPTAMIYQKIFETTNAELMWLPGVTLCDGIVAEYAEKKEKIIPSHNFANDIAAAARNIAERYHCDSLHTSNVEYLALNVFDSIKKLHGLGKRERLLLQIAVILHNCGEYINMNDVSANSYHIIKSTEIIGLSHLEREIVACLAYYYSKELPDYINLSGEINQENYIKITKLTAILRIANAMDKSHRQKLSIIKLTLKENELIITADTLNDITLEKGLFDKKADFFEEVYGIRPILKQKRSI